MPTNSFSWWRTLQLRCQIRSLRVDDVLGLAILPEVLHHTLSRFDGGLTVGHGLEQGYQLVRIHRLDRCHWSLHLLPCELCCVNVNLKNRLAELRLDLV